jgi:puromycin-sensitive aminopeptidase
VAASPSSQLKEHDVAEAPSYRLPRTVEPKRYELTLTPDLDAATFAGEARIDVQIHETVTEVVLNAVELDIHAAELIADDGAKRIGHVTLDAAEERAIIELDGAADPGDWHLYLTFTGILNDKLRGFYRSSFKDADGNERVIATTQFEATDARRAFPCWDEPDFKATFAVTLIVDASLTALSNGAEIDRHDLGNGNSQVTFAETMPMSTYLVAFVVGPFDLTAPADVGGVPLRIATTPGKQHLTPFAVEAGTAALRFLEDYFEIPYPGGKLDHVAIPDFAFGAMENLGCVTYRETALLVDASASSRLELERVAAVIAHETAHMWFGDLVTMKWWNGIWLNEAFATFMEITTLDQFRPEWAVWVGFGAGRSAAMVTDGLTTTRPVEFPVGRPEEADEMFDVLTYQKGAAVLRMLEQYLGPDVFRQGIVRYLNEHRYRNTETTDLWDAIEAASGEPARAVMDSWIDQGGYPLVSVEPAADGRQLVLSQRRFLYSGGDGRQRWQVPINLRASVAGEVVHRRLLLNTASTTIDLGGPVDWVVVNDGASGFYRVRYEASLRRALTGVMHGQLGPLERLALISDTWAAVLAGHSPLADFLELIRLVGDETDPDVWSAVLGPLGVLDRITTDEERAVLQESVRRIVGPALAKLGWDPQPSEAERTGTLRGRLINAAGTLGADPEVRTEAALRFAAYLEDPSSLAPDLITATVNVVARAGGEAEYTTILNQFRRAATPQDEVRYLYALGASEVAALLRRTLEMCLSGEVRTQDAPYVIGSIVATRAGARLAWDFVEEHWDAITSRFPDNSIPRMLEAIAGISESELAVRVHAFLDAHPVPQGTKLLAQARERMDITVALRARVAPSLAKELAATF